MNARTIQHPGVEIREIDMSEYTQSIIVNNAYVIGFADRGPIYDYSWVTTKSEFLKIYGQPQNEAQKYLYYAVMSILNNGGTPIISRMPYDNKQCKAYKGLAIRYAGVTTDYPTDTNPDDDVVYGWSNSPKKSGDYFPDFNDGTEGVIALKGTNAIPLSANIVIPLSGIANLLGEEDSPEEILYKLQNNISLSSGVYTDATVMNLLWALNPVTEEEIVDYLGGIESISATVQKYVLLDGSNRLSASMHAYALLCGGIKTCEEYDGTQNITTMATSLTKNRNDANEYLEQLAEVSAYTAISAENLGYKDGAAIIGYFSKPLLSSDVSVDKIVRYELVDSNDWLDMELSDLEGAYVEQLSSVATNTYSDITTGSIHYVKQGTRVAGLSGTLKKAIVNPNIALSSSVSKVLKQYLSVTNTCENIKNENNARSLYEDVAREGLKFYGVEPASLGISQKAVKDLIDKCHAIIETPISSVVGYNDIDEEHRLSTNVTAEQYAGWEALLNIYNSPKFWNLAASVDSKDIGASINQAIIDAKLLEQGAVGFSNAIFLDSKEVEISNYQYDDLVTGQKFTGGQNMSDPDAVEDIDFKYRSDIRAANFIIIDKNKTIAAGEGSNEGYFVTIIDPYDALKAQRLLGTPYTESELTNNSNYDPNEKIEYWIEQNKVDWRNAINNEINNVNLIQHVYNADNVLIGQTATGKRHKNLMDSWSVALTGGYYDESISKNLGNLFPAIPLADIKPGQKTGMSVIDKIYATHICVAVCKTLVDPANGKITVAIVESFFGSLLDERDPQTGKQLYIGNIINSKSKYIEFYRNEFVKNPYGDDPLQIRIPQVYMKNSAELKAAADTAAIDLALYDANDSMDAFVPEEFISAGTKGQTAFTFEEFCELYDAATSEGSRLYYAHEAFENFAKKLASIANTSNWPKNGTEMMERKKEFEQIYEDYFRDADADNYLNDALTILPSDFTDNLQYYTYNKLIKDLNYKANIFIFDKTNTVFYNNHPVCYFTSFSRKESQKIIANTTGLGGPSQGTTANVAKNFIVDMDRCIKFIRNVDDVSIFFVVDAGLSSIAQFCDDIVWDYFKKQKAFEPVTGGWITQGYDPDHDQDASDRQITCIEDINTWRTVVAKLDEISKETRRDCMTIIDAPRQLTLDGAAPKIRRSRPTNEWETKIGDKLQFIGGLNSSYTAGYYNWLRMTDTFSGKSFWLPPTCKVIGNLMYLNIMNLPWLAPAGFNYGVVTGIHAVSHNPGYKEEDQIYLKSWNYIKQYPYEGFIIEGQKTTLTKNSAFNRINVRTLFLDLERFVYNISKTYKYTVNNQYTREQYVQTLTPKFSEYQSRGGLYEYKIVCDETNNTWETIDANELRATIYIKPARLIEYILVDFVCTKSGANFEELT